MDSSLPTWLPDLGMVFSYLSNQDELVAERDASEFANLPWPYFIEQKLTANGDNPHRLLDFFAQKYPALLPVSLQATDPVHLPEDIFDASFGRDYHVVPFNFSLPFLSVAVVDPDTLTQFYPSYVSWAKEHKFSLLQYFVVLPSDVLAYKEKPDPKK
jgi:hypothetical protein